MPQNMFESIGIHSTLKEWLREGENHLVFQMWSVVGDLFHGQHFLKMFWGSIILCKINSNDEMYFGHLSATNDALLFS